jgi:hypothetical protein
MTGINRTRVSSMLNQLVTSELVIQHKLFLSREFLIENPKYESLSSKNKSNYYLVNINNNSVLKCIVHPLPSVLKLYLDYGEPLKFKELISKKLEIIPERLDEYYDDIPYDIIKEVEEEVKRDFHLKDELDIIFQYIPSENKIDMSKEKNTVTRDYSEILKEAKKEHEEDKRRSKKISIDMKQALSSEFEKFKKNNFMKWDFLICMCVNDTDKKYTNDPLWYRYLWNIIEEFEHKDR